MRSSVRPFLLSALLATLFIGCANQREARTEEETTPPPTEVVPPLSEILVEHERPLTVADAQVPANVAGAKLARQLNLSGALRPEFNTEDYGLIEENTFKMALDNPLSTFSIDVDAASYSNVRRFIRGGQAPPVDAVRIEELINYFSYDYPEASPGHPFSTTLEVGSAPWNQAHQLVTSA